MSACLKISHLISTYKIEMKTGRVINGKNLSLLTANGRALLNCWEKALIMDIDYILDITVYKSQNHVWAELTEFQVGHSVYFTDN